LGLGQGTLWKWLKINKSPNLVGREIDGAGHGVPGREETPAGHGTDVQNTDGRGKDNVSRDNWFQMADSTGRVTRAAEDPLNLRIPQARLEVRRQFFSHRVPTHWNRIPPDLKAAATTNRFKNGYRRLRSRRDPTQEDE